MGILSALLDGGGLGGKIADLVKQRMENKEQGAALAAEAQRLVEQHQHEVALKVLDLEAQIAAAQSATNQIEAGSDSLFKSGWRPAIGWICGFALAYQMVVRPLVSYAFQNVLAMPPPSLEMDTLLTLLFAILGLGAYRTYEKTR